MLRSTLRSAFAGLAAGVALLAAAGPAAAHSPAPPPTLRFDGIGPLRLGMRTAAAVRTGWLARRGRGCPLGGRPVPITYRLNGPRARGGIVGVAEFRFGRLRNLSFTRGVRTALGVVPGSTRRTTMVNRYRRAGFSVRAQFVDTFGGAFVTVGRGRLQVLGGFATRSVVRTVGIPHVPTCE